MILLTIDNVPGREIEALGLVKGTVVQSKNFGKDFMAGMKTIVGGEIKGYTEMLIEDKGEFTGIREARKHLGWYLTGMRGAAAMRHRINLAETKEAIFALLDELVCSIHEYEKSAPENRAHII